MNTGANLSIIQRIADFLGFNTNELNAFFDATGIQLADVIAHLTSLGLI